MITELNEICLFRQLIPIENGSIKTNDDKLASVKSALKKIKSELERRYSDYNNQKLRVEISTGQSYFPNVIHICILPKSQSVSDGIYVGLCFDIKGRGAVVGCMESITNPKGLNTVKRLLSNKQKKTLILDVDGGRPTTKYNNSFENPREFIANNFDESKLYSHINESLNIALLRLNLIEEVVNTIVSEEDKSSNEDDYNPTNNIDARKKILRQIAERPGQQKFRDALLNAYSNRCAITLCDVIHVLEAAHIMPYHTTVRIQIMFKTGYCLEQIYIHYLI